MGLIQQSKGARPGERCLREADLSHLRDDGRPVRFHAGVGEGAHLQGLGAQTVGSRREEQGHVLVSRNYHSCDLAIFSFRAFQFGVHRALRDELRRHQRRLVGRRALRGSQLLHRRHVQLRSSAARPEKRGFGISITLLWPCLNICP